MALTECHPERSEGSLKFLLANNDFISLTTCPVIIYGRCKETALQ